MFKKLKKWIRSLFQVRILTEKSLQRIYEDIEVEYKWRFGSGESLTSPAMSSSELSLGNYNNLFSDHLSRQELVQSDFASVYLKEDEGKKRDNSSHLLSASTVAYAASNGWLSSDYLHWRHQVIDELRELQDIVYTRMWEDPYLSSAVHQFLFYVLGTGYTFETPNSKISTFLEEFDHEFKYTSTTGIAGKKIWALMSLGEFYLKVWISSTGIPSIERVFPYEVVRVQRHPVRRDCILAYKVVLKEKTEGQWIKDIHFDDYLERDDWQDFPVSDEFAKEMPSLRNSNNYIHYTKMGWGEELLGRVPVEPALRSLKYREDFNLARVVLNKERARVIWKKILKGSAHRRTATDRYLPPPTPGMMLVADENTDYVAISADIKADEVQDDYKMLLYAIAATFSIPLELLDLRGNETVYASIKKTSNPFHQRVMVLRSLVWGSDEDLMQFLLVQRRELAPRSLPKKVQKKVRNPEYPLNSDENFVTKTYLLKDTPLVATWSNNFSEDWAQLAKATKELTEAATGDSILSKTTARKQLGLNDAEEDSLIQSEKSEEDKKKETENGGKEGKTTSGNGDGS